MSDIEETTRQISCARRVEGGVGEAFARAVRRGEVFDRGEAFFQRRHDREFNDLSARVRNESFHAGHLMQLHGATASTGRDHVVDGASRIKRFKNVLTKFS